VNAAAQAALSAQPTSSLQHCVKKQPSVPLALLHSAAFFGKRDGKKELV